jgi:hypothetical protein
VDHGLAIDIADESDQAFLEFVFGADADVAQHVKVKRPIVCAASQFVVSRETWAEWLSRMTSIAVSAG